MTPTFYVDYVLMVDREQGDSEVAKAASTLLKALHAGFSEFAGEFALAFPNIEEKGLSVRLKVFRVFSENPSSQERLNAFLARSKHYGSLFIATFMQRVEDDFNGSYKAYFRDRVRSRNRPDERHLKMTELIESNALWIDNNSTSNRNNFRMYFRAISSDIQYECGTPNSYGLSTRDGLAIFVPHIAAR